MKKKRFLIVQQTGATDPSQDHLRSCYVFFCIFTLFYLVSNIAHLDQNNFIRNQDVTWSSLDC